MTISVDALKEVMRNWTTGVAILTSFFGEDKHGMTINSFTSVSVNPAIVVATLANNTRTYELVKKSNKFGVTILSVDQKELSDRFAGKIFDREDRFTGIETFTLKNASPLIVGGLAWVDCEVIKEVYLGESTLFLAEVVASKASSGPTLLYHNRDYYRLGEKI